jgi:hypothetical protein
MAHLRRSASRRRPCGRLIRIASALVSKLLAGSERHRSQSQRQLADRGARLDRAMGIGHLVERK